MARAVLSCRRLNTYSDVQRTMAKKHERRVLDEREATQLAELFRALGDASRVRILSAIAKGERNVGAIADIVGISESAVSHHLRGLRQMRLVRARKDGRQVYYSVDDEHVATLFNQGLEHVRHG
ncbi:MAG: metalloregulator ArsR/SmtB family transcription factor [Anaerolineae bacterium]|nr:metalloregulator ArsR/SmtB family transcription factor [Anaerolineae bacterium]